MFSHILVPTDGSELAQRAVDRAIDFARDVGAKLTIVCVVPRFPFLLHPEVSLIDAVAPIDFQREAERQAQEVVAAAVRQARAAGIEAEGADVASGAPYRAIIDAAGERHCDLIFMASRRRRGIGATLVGSETQKVLTHTRIPVPVYH